MATWKKVATETTIKDTVVCVPLYLSSINGIKSGNVSFLRPLNTNYFSESPKISFSSDIQQYSGGIETFPGDPGAAYFDYPGDFSMETNGLDDNLLESIGGCVFSVPAGDQSRPFHTIKLDVMISNEEASTDATDSDATIHFNLWRANVVQNTTWGNGASSSTLRFKLVEDHMIPSVSTATLPHEAASIKTMGFKEISVTQNGSGSTDWGGTTSYYLLGCWVDSTAATVNLDTSNSINWPLSGGTGNCSIKAWAHVEYRRYISG